MERIVLGRREKSMVGFRWSGTEPKGFNDVQLAEQFGAVWEGTELVTYDMPSLIWQMEHMSMTTCGTTTESRRVPTHRAC